MYRQVLPSFKKKGQMLGRWEIDYREHIIKKKVEMANEDHCGPCGFTNEVLKKK